VRRRGGTERPEEAVEDRCAGARVPPSCCAGGVRTEMDVKVSDREPEYSGGECCRVDPFCAEHGERSGSKYYLMRVGTSGRADVVIDCCGGRMKDSWCLGRLDGMEHVALRYLVSRAVCGAKGCGDGSSSSETSSDLSSFAGSEGDRMGGWALCGGDAMEAGLRTPLLGDGEGTYGGCRVSVGK
jgi:hypothetical protein